MTTRSPQKGSNGSSRNTTSSRLLAVVKDRIVLLGEKITEKLRPYAGRPSDLLNGCLPRKLDAEVNALQQSEEEAKLAQRFLGESRWDGRRCLNPQCCQPYGKRRIITHQATKPDQPVKLMCDHCSQELEHQATVALQYGDQQLDLERVA